MAEGYAYARLDSKRAKALDWAREAFREQSYRRYKYACSFHRKNADPHDVPSLCGAALAAHHSRMRQWEQQAAEDFVRPVPNLAARHERVVAARIAGGKRSRVLTADEDYERQTGMRARAYEEGEIEE